MSPALYVYAPYVRTKKVKHCYPKKKVKRSANKTAKGSQDKRRHKKEERRDKKQER
jgi:hypothetical protein